MKLHFEITVDDIKKVKEFISENQNALVQNRSKKNIENNNIIIDQDTVIRGITMCLLTSMQKSGPDSPVANFLNIRPFPFNVNSLSKNNDTKEFISKVLSRNNLNRFKNRIPESLTENFNKILILEKWKYIKIQLDSLRGNNDKFIERSVAVKIQSEFKGMGAKQSRNLLQFLGLTKFEIPIDSRITKKLVEWGFPIPISSRALQDEQYYHFVLDHFQMLCERVGKLPCILDAIIFSSFDKNGWSSNRIPY